MTTGAADSATEPGRPTTDATDSSASPGASTNGATDPAPSPGDPTNGAVVERRVAATGGVELALRLTNAEGAEPPILLVHGLASNARTWDGVAGRLAALGHPVAAVDQRGHGRSDKPPDGGYDFATVCADLACVVAALGWSDPARRPLVAGQSWGGNVVLELAIRHPDVLRAAACVDGGTIELARRFPTWEWCQAAMAPPKLTGLTVGEFESLVRTWHRDWSASGVAATVANMEVRPDGTITPWLSLDHHLAILRHLWEHHPPQRWPLVTVPVLLIPSAMANVEGIEAARSGLAPEQLRVVPFPGADHDVHIQHPDEVADVLHEAAVSVVP